MSEYDALAIVQTRICNEIYGMPNISRDCRTDDIENWMNNISAFLEEFNTFMRLPSIADKATKYPFILAVKTPDAETLCAYVDGVAHKHFIGVTSLLDVENIRITGQSIAVMHNGNYGDNGQMFQ